MKNKGGRTDEPYIGQTMRAGSSLTPRPDGCCDDDNPFTEALNDIAITSIDEEEQNEMMDEMAFTPFTRKAA